MADVLLGFDDDPTYKEHKAGKQKQVEQVTVVATLGHRGDSAHRRLQETGRVVKIVVLNSMHDRVPILGTCKRYRNSRNFKVF